MLVRQLLVGEVLAVLDRIIHLGIITMGAAIRILVCREVMAIVPLLILLPQRQVIFFGRLDTELITRFPVLCVNPLQTLKVAVPPNPLHFISPGAEVEAQRQEVVVVPISNREQTVHLEVEVGVVAVTVTQMVRGQDMDLTTPDQAAEAAAVIITTTAVMAATG